MDKKNEIVQWLKSYQVHMTNETECQIVLDIIKQFQIRCSWINDDEIVSSFLHHVYHYAFYAGSGFNANASPYTSNFETASMADFLNVVYGEDSDIEFEIPEGFL